MADPKGDPIRRVRPVSELERTRRALGLTQEQLAERVGISTGYLGVIEGGLRPSARLTDAIASACEREACELFPKEGKR